MPTLKLSYDTFHNKSSRHPTNAMAVLHTALNLPGIDNIALVGSSLGGSVAIVALERCLSNLGEDEAIRTEEQDRRAGHPSSLNKKRAGGHPSFLNKRRAGHPSFLNKRRAGHPSFLNKRRAGHPSFLNKRRAGHPSFLNQKIWVSFFCLNQKIWVSLALDQKIWVSLALLKSLPTDSFVFG